VLSGGSVFRTEILFNSPLVLPIKLQVKSGVAGMLLLYKEPELKACRIVYEIGIAVKLFQDQLEDILIKGLTN
jgi:hypothetical protein